MTAPDPRPLPRVTRSLLRGLTASCRGVVDEDPLGTVDTEAEAYFAALNDAARSNAALTLAALPLPPDAAALGRALWPVADLVRLAIEEGREGATLALADHVLDVIVRVALLQEARTTSLSGVVGLVVRDDPTGLAVALTCVDPFDVADDNPVWRVDR